MASKHTEKYGLNQWEGSDLFIRTEFNEDNQKIDAALAGLAGQLGSKASQTALNSLTSTVNTKASQADLNSLTATVNTKASQAALNNLTAVVNTKASQAALDSLSVIVAKKGNCRIETGSYTGAGTGGSGNPNRLSFSGRPVFVMVSGVGDSHMFLSGQTETGRTLALGSGTGEYNQYSWSGNTVSWYCPRSYDGIQMNTAGRAYFWAALFLTA